MASSAIASTSAPLASSARWTDRRRRRPRDESLRRTPRSIARASASFRRVLLTLAPIRPRSRGERRSLRTFSASASEPPPPPAAGAAGAKQRVVVIASSPSSSHQHHHRRGEDEEESDPWNKTPIAMDARLYAYLLKHTREPEVLRALRVETAALRGSQMQVPPEQGALLFTLCAMLRATHVVEIGTFTGYSSVAMALALPHDGTLTACDVSEPSFEVARAYWERAGVRGKIVERLGDAQATLDAMLAGDDDDDGDDDGDGAGGEKINHRGRYDFAFVDADKRGYWAYYEKLLELVRPGGVIAIDNVLWYGKVADPEVNDKQTIAIREFNEKVARDERISAHVTVPIGDGLTLCVVR